MDAEGKADDCPSDYLIVGAILFSLSVAGIFLNRKNVILLLMCIELMLLAVNMNFVAAFPRDRGPGLVFFILTVAAAEAAIGPAILVVLFRNRRTINVADPGYLEWLRDDEPILLTIVLATCSMPSSRASRCATRWDASARTGDHSRCGRSCVLSLYVLWQFAFAGAATHNETVYTWMVTDGLRMEIGFLIDV